MHAWTHGRRSGDRLSSSSAVWPIIMRGNIEAATKEKNETLFE